jgi:hypothetical protein
MRYNANSIEARKFIGTHVKCCENFYDKPFIILFLDDIVFDENGVKRFMLDFSISKKYNWIEEYTPCPF